MESCPAVVVGMVGGCFLPPEDFSLHLLEVFLLLMFVVLDLSSNELTEFGSTDRWFVGKGLGGGLCGQNGGCIVDKFLQFLGSGTLSGGSINVRLALVGVEINVPGKGGADRNAK